MNDHSVCYVASYHIATGSSYELTVPQLMTICVLAIHQDSAIIATS